jgi:hypothetical protein
MQVFPAIVPTVWNGKSDCPVWIFLALNTGEKHAEKTQENPPAFL